MEESRSRFPDGGELDEALYVSSETIFIIYKWAVFHFLSTSFYHTDEFRIPTL